MTVNVYHKHSVVKDKAPTPAQAELGELLLNANQDSFAIYLKDSADTIQKVGGDITQIENDIQRIKRALHLHGDNIAEEHENYEEWLQQHDNQLQLHQEHLEAIDAEIEALKKELALLQAGDDKDIEDLQARVAALESTVNQLAADINKIDQEQEKIKDRLTQLETIDVDGGTGIKVERTDAYKFKVSIDEDWLEAYVAKALEPYMLKDIKTNTGSLS